MSIRKGSLITMLLSFIAATSVVAGNDTMKKTAETATGKFEEATFAGGCFWCMEAPFDKLPGVVSVTSGYTGGNMKHPTYKQVSAGGTGHAEAGQVVYEVTGAGEFYPAEEYHQHYYKKNPIRYRYYRNGCGRDQRLKELWGDAAGH